MFTGLVQEIGHLLAREEGPFGIELKFAAPFSSGLAEGESVSVSGVCLTSNRADQTGFHVYASEETLTKSTLGALAVGGRVNMERAMLLTDRLGGHLVQGHVDGKAVLASSEQRGPGTILTFSLAPELSRYLILKGSIALDGVSLTVNTIENDVFSIYVIPHTLEKTTLSDRSPGDTLNVEVDLVAKYVERFLHPQQSGASERPSLESLLTGTGLGSPLW